MEGESREDGMTVVTSGVTGPCLTGRPTRRSGARPELASQPAATGRGARQTSLPGFSLQTLGAKASARPRVLLHHRAPLSSMVSPTHCWFLPLSNRTCSTRSTFKQRKKRPVISCHPLGTTPSLLSSSKAACTRPPSSPPTSTVIKATPTLLLGRHQLHSHLHHSVPSHSPCR